ncbi:PAS domain-containing protein [Noviherbaspirillum pedocola]|uniref:histidine kinase n=1 Tax=Noviherbaspirillum pedocola TaxID=2801341 RepID=A0A934W925_9BURK|nr:PAS domain-containing protein [Noviherbaspirillum pedocola]MBK4739347.1 PAS domain-containing protein [Noviherbaspirillum pedocola]
MSANDPIWDWDSSTNALWWSLAIRALFGISPDEMTTSIESWKGLIHSENEDWVLESIYEAIASRRNAWTAEYRFQRKDGNYAEVFERAFIVRDRNGLATCMVGGMSDLRERKQSKLRVEGAPHFKLMQWAVRARNRRTQSPFRDLQDHRWDRWRPYSLCELCRRKASFVASLCANLLG